MRSWKANWNGRNDSGERAGNASVPKHSPGKSDRYMFFVFSTKKVSLTLHVFNGNVFMMQKSSIFEISKNAHLCEVRYQRSGNGFL